MKSAFHCKTTLILIPLLCLLSQSCQYDIMEEIHPVIPCDTTGIITFDQNILPIVNLNCGTDNSACHNTGGVQINLQMYDETKDAADEGSLLGSIRHESPFVPMPNGGVKLDDCTIQTITAWVNRGTPEN